MPVSLSLPLRENRYVGEPVVAVFDNLLPDGEGLRRRIAGRVRADGTDNFSLLTALGYSKRRRKQRTQCIYGTTKGVVSQHPA